MLKRIILHLLLTVVISTALAIGVFSLAFYGYAQFGVYVDFGISYILNWVLYCNVIFLVFSLPAMLMPLPFVKNNLLLRLLFYFGGCLVVAVFLLISTDWHDPESIIIGWVPLVIFAIVHAYFYVRLARRTVPAPAPITPYGIKRTT